MYVFQTLVPVFVLIGIGYILVKQGIISKSSVKDFNGLVYYIGLPTLLFYQIGRADVNLSAAINPVLLCLISVACGLVAGAAAVFFRKQSSGDIGSIIQVIVRANTVFIGLPVIIYFFESIHYPDMSYVNNLAMLSLSIFSPINTTISVIVLIIGRPPHKRVFSVFFRSVVMNPIIFACIAGIIYSSLFDGFFIPIERTFRAVAGMTLPLSLIAVGCILAEIKISDNYADLWAISLIKLIVMPLAVFAAGKALHFDSESIGIAMIFMACPTGSTCVTLAQQLNGDVKLTSTAIIGTSVLSMFTMAAVLMLCNSLFQ